jgi:O-antigen/teichoic acid export membrane protein
MGKAAMLVRGSVFRTTELAVVVGSAFFVTPALVRALGDRVFGFWTLVTAFIGYYGLLDLGLTQAAARYLAQALGQGDREELERTAGTAFALFTGIAAAVMALTLVSCWATPLWIRDPAEAAILRRLLLVLGAAAAIGFPAKVYSGLLTADIRYDIIAGISIARSALNGAAIYAAAVSGRGVLTVAAITFAASVLQVAVTYWAFRRCFPGLTVRPRRAERGRARQMLAHGWNTMVCQLGDIMRFRLGTAIVGTYLGAALVTPFSVGARIVEAFVQLVLGVVGMMLPIFSQFEGRGDYGSIRSALLQATKLGTILSTFVGLSVVFYGRAFVERWMGPGFGPAYGVAAILAAGFMLDLPQSPGVQLLYGLSKHRPYALLNVVEGAANVLLSIALVRRFGLYGVALGTAIEFAVFKLLIQPAYVCRPIGLPVRVYMVDTILVTFLKSAAPLGLFFLAARRFIGPSYGRVLACGAAQTAFFAPIAYAFVLDAAERRLVAGALASLRPGVKVPAEAA